MLLLFGSYVFCVSIVCHVAAVWWRTGYAITSNVACFPQVQHINNPATACIRAGCGRMRIGGSRSVHFVPIEFVEEHPCYEVPVVMQQFLAFFGVESLAVCQEAGIVKHVVVFEVFE